MVNHPIRRPLSIANGSFEGTQCGVKFRKGELIQQNLEHTQSVGIKSLILGGGKLKWKLCRAPIKYDDDRVWTKLRMLIWRYLRRIWSKKVETWRHMAPDYRTNTTKRGQMYRNKCGFWLVYPVQISKHLEWVWKRKTISKGELIAWWNCRANFGAISCVAWNAISLPFGRWNKYKSVDTVQACLNKTQANKKHENVDLRNKKLVFPNKETPIFSPRRYLPRQAAPPQCARIWHRGLDLATWAFLLFCSLRNECPHASPFKPPCVSSLTMVYIFAKFCEYLLQCILW